MTDIKHKLELKCDSSRLAAIIDNAVIATSEIVNFHFNALSDADLSKPALRSEATFNIKGPELSVEQRGALHENWILARAFHELLRAVRYSLEEAHIFVVLLTKTHKIKSCATLSEFLRPFRTKAANLPFPQLLAAVNEKLDPKLAFADCYKSLQIARNCLEHRNGVVSKIETHNGEMFELSIPRIKIFYMREGAEVEIAKGHRVDPGDDRKNVEIFSKLDARCRSIPLGERITFTLTEFNEIAFACHFLGQQLATKLPKPTIPEE